MADKTAAEKVEAGEELTHEDVRALEHPEEADAGKAKPAAKTDAGKSDA